MKTKILELLSQLEKQYDIEILFAVESGSRAWGFESPDSDYDIRFVYKHSKGWYLNLWEQKDTIQFMTEDDLDGVGWDLRKAMKLLAKSNASFLGWLFSPMIYRANMAFLEDLKALAQENFNPVSGFYHYHSMNKGFNELLDTKDMTLKSYFYALRTALCAHWIAEKGTIPPVLFTDLYPLIDNKYQEKLNELIVLKSQEDEKSQAAIDPVLIALAKRIVAKNETAKGQLTHRQTQPELINNLFLKTIS
jgi:predicted nucleotidyltransferase